MKIFYEFNNSRSIEFRLGNKALLVFKIAELEQAAALKYLYGWLRNHPKYGTLAPPELADSLYYADVSVIFGNMFVSLL